MGVLFPKAGLHKNKNLNNNNILSESLCQLKEPEIKSRLYQKTNFIHLILKLNIRFEDF